MRGLVLEVGERSRELSPRRARDREWGDPGGLRGVAAGCYRVAIPAPGPVFSPFGWREVAGRHDLHTGIDILAPEGAPVRAMLPGVVVLADALNGYGNTVVVRHAPTLFSLYAHLASPPRHAKGAAVGVGEVLGGVGRSAGKHGEVFQRDPPHLHLEFLRRWPPAGRDLDRIDPAEVLGPLGVIVPRRGPILAPCGPEDPSPAPAGVVAPESPDRFGPTKQGIYADTSRSAGSGLGVIALFFLLARWGARDG